MVLKRDRALQGHAAKKKVEKNKIVVNLEKHVQKSFKSLNMMRNLSDEEKEILSGPGIADKSKNKIINSISLLNS